jgi:hypothetical protein
MEYLFVIPQQAQSIIAKIQDNQIIEIATIDIPFYSKTVYCPSKEVFISINFREKALKMYNREGLYLGFNNQFEFKCIAIKEEIIYLGGAYKKKKNGLGELCSMLDLNEVDFKFKQINLPIVALKNKAIDDIVIIDDKLILLDNIVFPKYIFEFDISNPRVPIHTNTFDLPDNGTYEHIVKGDGNEKWLGIKSSTVGQCGSTQHLTIHGNHKVKMEYSTDIYKSETTNDAIFISDQYDDTQDDFIREYIDDYFSKSKAEREILLNGENGAMYEYIQEIDDYKNKLIFSKPILDFCIVDDYLLIMQSKAIYAYDLNSYPSKKITTIKTRLTDFNRFIKTPDQRVIVIGPQGYELLC